MPEPTTSYVSAGVGGGKLGGEEILGAGGGKLGGGAGRVGTSGTPTAWLGVVEGSGTPPMGTSYASLPGETAPPRAGEGFSMTEGRDTTPALGLWGMLGRGGREGGPEGLERPEDEASGVGADRPAGES